MAETGDGGIELLTPSNDVFTLHRETAIKILKNLDELEAAAICSVRGSSARLLPRHRSVPPEALTEPTFGARDGAVLIVCPIMFEGGCFEHSLANLLVAHGIDVVLAVTQDVDPRRFVALDPAVRLKSVGRKQFGDIDVASFKQFIQNSTFSLVIISRHWMLRAGLLSDLMLDRKEPILGCDRGMAFYDEALEREKFYDRFDAISVMLEEYRDTFSARLADRIEIHGLFPKIANITPQAHVRKVDDDLVNMCHFGRISSDKNVLDLVPIMSSLVERGRFRFRFHFIGSGPLTAALMDAVLKAGLDEHVVFAGYADRPETVLSKMDVSVSCSRFEGIPNAVLEALQLGVPFVGYGDIPGHRYLVEQHITGCLVEPGQDSMKNCTSFCEAIESAIALPDMSEWEPALHRLNEKCSFDETARSWLQTYDRLAAPDSHMTDTVRPDSFEETRYPFAEMGFRQI